MIWILTALLTAGATWALIRPLAQARATAADATDDPLAIERALHDRRLKDIERDLTRGTVTAEEAEGLRAEAARVLLARTRSLKAQGGHRTGPGVAAKPWFLALMVAIPGVTLGLYLWQGALSEEADWQAQMAQNQRQRQQVEQLLSQSPDDPGVLLDTARARLDTGDRDGAFQLLDHLLRLVPDMAQTEQGFYVGAVIEMRIAARAGTIDGRSAQIIDRALELAPDDPRVRFYHGYLEEKRGNLESAIDIWVALLADSPADAGWVEPVRRELARLDAQAAETAQTLPPSQPSPGQEGLPDGAQAVMDMSPEERAQFMADRVDALRARVEDGTATAEDLRMLARVEQSQGNDAAAADALGTLGEMTDNPRAWIASGQGWLAAGEPEQALIAFRAATALDASLADAWAMQAMLLVRLERIPEATDSLKRALEVDDTNTIALFESARLAAMAGEQAQAEALFGRALASLPEDSPARTSLRAQADAILSQIPQAAEPVEEAPASGTD